MRVVFLHGAASSPDVWARQHRHFKDAGYFRYPEVSSAPKALIDAYVEAVLASVSEPVVLVGHSLGGAVAQVAALRAPDRVAAAVLVSTGPHLPVNPDLLTGLINRPEDTLDRVARWSVAKSAPATLVDRSRELARGADPDLAYRQFAACNHFDLRGHAPYPGRAGIIFGSQDRMTPPSLVRQLAEVFVNAVEREIPDAGHLVMLEQPDAFNQALHEVLALIGTGS